jgi:hypothetical protein
VDVDVKLEVAEDVDENELGVVDVDMEVTVEVDDDVGTEEEEDEVSGTMVLETEEAALFDGERATKPPTPTARTIITTTIATMMPVRARREFPAFILNTNYAVRSGI